MKEYYEFFSPVKILAGAKALEQIPYECGKLGAARPLLVTDRGVLAAGLIDVLRKSLSDSQLIIPAMYDVVPPDSSVETVRETAAFMDEYGCDSIIAVGGGSVLDTAKGVKLARHPKNANLRRAAGAHTAEVHRCPVVAVPTTAGTGSEATLAAVIADHGEKRKLLFVSHRLLPEVAVIDPRMTETLPPKLTAATGMDALTHAVEAMSCLGKNPVSDAHASAAVRLIAENLPRVCRNPKDTAGRFALAQAATLAGIAFSNSMVGLVHTIGHSLGSVCGLPHGTAMSILLPHCLAFNLRKKPRETSAALSEILLPLAGPDAYAATPAELRPEKTLEGIRALRKELRDTAGLPERLKDTGVVTREQFDEIAGVALGDASLIYNPAEANREEIVTVLEAAW